MKGFQWIAGLAVAAFLGASAPARAVSPGAAKAMGTAIADIVEEVMPAVVVVRTEATRFRLAQDWFFGRMYRIPERLAGMGSGVIITKDGYLLTNRHVVDGAQNIEVVMQGGEKYAARLVGEDPQTDLAVLKIEDSTRAEFPYLAPGNSDTLRVGEFVMAIGSPFSLSSSVTLGIVSQKGRAIGALPYEDFIQTDAAVNRGNSGGPLVDMDGKLVGINTMIQTAGYSEGNIGISFAIPINLAMNVATSIMRDGNWRRPWVGIMMQEEGDGVRVGRVMPQSPASRAGLVNGDLITAVDGERVRQPREVQRLIMSRKAGDAVAMTVRRSKKDVVLNMTTEAMPAPPFLYVEE
ncbi:MAG TPA: trypsin-like peptidase domain-containing protein [Kiritimatiellia bacterium]|nr:trypsin-like peptidase domain-containing protein [Kiritimatiellia bacterium]